MLKKFLNKLYSVKYLSILILLTGIVYLLAIHFILNPTILQLSFLFILFIVFYLIIIIHVGKERARELSEIKSVIKKIRNNEYVTSHDISLSNRLGELEDEIKLMFIRSRNDIENLKKLEQVRTEFLGNVSHELRTPIFSIQGYLETLLDGALEDPKVNKLFLQKANNHTINLNNLLNDLIDISMIESGQMKMSFRFFYIHEFLQGMFNEFKPIAEKKNLEIILKSANPKLQVYGDKNRLKQVISNLLTNAIKYSERGSVEFGIVEEPQFGRIYIKDTGFGIAEKDLKRIFERFYRVEKDRSREMGGTGLGLAIVKHIVEAHESKIEVKSQIGVGSEFYFRLKK